MSTDTDNPDDAGHADAGISAQVARRLRPLQLGMGLQSLLLWVPVEKIFMTRIGLDAAALFKSVLSLGADGHVQVLNDADAAGMAEVAHGAGRGQAGVVLLLTFGTGIGSALFLDGRLVPNTELGHLEIRGKEAEDRASARTKEEQDLSWGKWAGRVEEYLTHIEALFSPDLVIIGGGVSKNPDKFLPKLDLRAKIVPATLANTAGIVGAAMATAAQG